MNWSPRFWSSGTSGASRAARICSRVQRVDLSEGLVTVFPPMGLDEDAVDLFEVYNAGLVADGFDERTQAQVAGPTQQSFAGTDNEGEGFWGEGVVPQAGPVEL